MSKPAYGDAFYDLFDGTSSTPNVWVVQVRSEAPYPQPIVRSSQFVHSFELQ